MEISRVRLDRYFLIVVKEIFSPCCLSVCRLFAVSFIHSASGRALEAPVGWTSYYRVLKDVSLSICDEKPLTSEYMQCVYPLQPYNVKEFLLFLICSPVYSRSHWLLPIDVSSVKFESITFEKGSVGWFFNWLLWFVRIQDYFFRKNTPLFSV